MRILRGAFTLIELLVVLVLLGVLAALLLPAFARTRESARKSHCLANVKSIATAFQMYLSDYGRFPPSLHDKEAQRWLEAEHPGGKGQPGTACTELDEADPFLRHQVVLAEYIGSRQVWRCPSARTSVTAAWILPGDGGIWWQYLRDNVGRWGDGTAAGGPCFLAFPSGWGGTVTDSIAQQRRASDDTGAFHCSIGTSGFLADVTESQVQDAGWLIVCADTQHSAHFTTIADLLYSLCRTNDCACGDWSEGETCVLPADLLSRWHTDPTFRSGYTRHMGGANLGFADGHAKWWSAQMLEDAAPYCECCSPEAGLDGSRLVLQNRRLRGLCPVGVG